MDKQTNKQADRRRWIHSLPGGGNKYQSAWHWRVVLESNGESTEFDPWTRMAHSAAAKQTSASDMRKICGLQIYAKCVTATVQQHDVKI